MIFWTILFALLAFVFLLLALKVRSGHGDRAIAALLTAPRSEFPKFSKARLCAFGWKLFLGFALSMVVAALNIPLGSGAILLGLGLMLLLGGLGILYMNFARRFRRA